MTSRMKNLARRTHSLALDLGDEPADELENIALHMDRFVRLIETRCGDLRHIPTHRKEHQFLQDLLIHTERFPEVH